MKFKFTLLILFFTLFQSVYLFAQSDTITVFGKVVDKNNPYVWVPCMVGNKATGKGVMADNGGRFTIKLKKADTLIVGATGYLQQKFCFKDSSGVSFTLEVALEKKAIELKPVDVKPDRDLLTIEEELKKLEKEEVNTVTGVDVLKSPITALYERFSKIGKQKNLVAELEYEDKRRELLKELLSKYVKYDIIDLKDEEFDAFIDYLAMPMEFIQASEQYDLIMAIKYRYEMFDATRK